MVLLYTHMNQPWVYMCSPSWPPLPPPFPSHPSGSSQCTSPEHPNLDWWSMSRMMIYMFQCYSLKSSHPRLLPQSPKVCSLHLCLLVFFFRLYYKLQGSTRILQCSHEYNEFTLLQPDYPSFSTLGAFQSRFWLMPEQCSGVHKRSEPVRMWTCGFRNPLLPQPSNY